MTMSLTFQTSYHPDRMSLSRKFLVSILANSQVQANSWRIPTTQRTILRTSSTLGRPSSSWRKSSRMSAREVASSITRRTASWRNPQNCNGKFTISMSTRFSTCNHDHTRWNTWSPQKYSTSSSTWLSTRSKCPSYAFSRRGRYPESRDSVWSISPRIARTAWISKSALTRTTLQKIQTV